MNLQKISKIRKFENSKIPDKLEKELLNSICEPYIDSKYYDAHKKVDSSRVFNKTTGKNTRINLKSLIKMDYRTKTKKNRSLETIQKFPGEVLENMAVKIRQIREMKKGEDRSDTNKIKAAAFYTFDTITAPYLNLKTMIHEIALGIDEVYDENNIIYLSQKGKFKETFDNCIQKLEKSGRKVFDNQNPMKGNWAGMFGGATNYATYNEAEEFAICMQILMGTENTDTKYIKKYMPELIDAAKELYLEIRNKPQEERQKL